MIRPLGDRVLVKPDKVQTVSESGIELVEHWPIEHTGTIVSMGPQCSPFQREAHDLAQRIEKEGRLAYEPRDEDVYADAANMLRQLTACPLKLGDVVLFGSMQGQELTVEGEKFLLFRASDLLATIPEMV